jgi:hypothetical protein
MSDTASAEAGSRAQAAPEQRYQRMRMAESSDQGVLAQVTGVDRE